jgi:electron transfer flavoprotein beta subunit
MSVAKEISVVAKEGGYDLILAGKESSDYNGQMVPGMLAALLDYNFINGCVQMDVEGTSVTATREIDGGSESLQTNLPLVVGGQKGIVEESDLRIPNMRGIMMARKKPLNVLESINSENATNSVSFEKPAPKGAVKLVDAENIDQLINLLHNEAKVI